MEISDEQLDKYIAIYEAEFGEVLTRDEAYMSLRQLLRLSVLGSKKIDFKNGQ